MARERLGGTRVAIAQEAARMMYEEAIKEYFTAKRLAAKRVLGRVEGKRARHHLGTLPSNGEIRDALLSLAETAEGRGRRRKLFAMRVVALEVMRKLAPFEPRLIGSVSTGHVRRGSDIDLSLFTDDEEAVELQLRSLGLSFVSQRTTIHKFGQIREYLHHHLEQRFPVELTVYPRRELRFRPRSSTDGKPIVRLGLAALERLLLLEHESDWHSYRTTGVIAGLSDTTRDVDDEPSLEPSFEGWLELDQWEPVLPEPGEEEDPDQLYDPLPGFEHMR